MNPAIAFPKECDNEVGGVLIILLEPAVVEAKVDDIEEDEDDVEGDMRLEGTAAMVFLFEYKRESDLLVAIRFDRGADADNPL